MWQPTVTSVWLVIFVDTLLNLCIGANSILCPDQDITLKRWSSQRSWPGNKKPSLNDQVSIDFPVLLDESPPELQSITIQPGGRLVWSHDGDFDLTLKYIMIYGRMDIGSENCTFYRKAHITLTGIRGQYTINVGGIHDFGEKFIGVAPGGTLEIHAEKKLSWTKLTQTVPKLSTSNGLIYTHEDSLVSKSNNWKPGLVVYIFNEKTGKPVSGEYFYLGGSEPTLSKSDPKRLIQLINNVQKDSIVAMSVNKNMLDSAVDLRPIFTAIELLAFGSVTGNNSNVVTPGDAFVLIAQKANPNITKQEWVHKGFTDYQHASTSLTLPASNLRFSVESFVDNTETDKSRVDFRVTTIKAIHPIINLLDDVTTWKTGDKIVLASTDYDWQQAEVATIVNCPKCTPNQIQIELDARYMHYGNIIKNVDERGEVALLTRNVLIEGKMEDRCPISNQNCQDFNYDTFGGNIKFVKGFRNVHLEGVELYHMGQQTDIGQYPVNFDMCYDVDSYNNPPYLRDSTVHHSFARCVTIHGTNGVMVNDNVCFDCLGHAYFLEDGGEKRNTFDGNIGLSTRKGKQLLSDSNPATFWMTNPVNYLRNNVAAGSAGYGISYVFPDEPYGKSQGLGFMKKYEALHTPYLQYYNNVAHSNGLTGLFADGKVLPTTATDGNNDYSPRLRPLDPNSPPGQVNIIRPTLYKNRERNMMLRGGWLKVDRGSFSDSAVGAMFARSDDQSQSLSNSVIIGESLNYGEAESSWKQIGLSVPRSLPFQHDKRIPIQGFNFNDGPVYLDKILFSSFVSNNLYPAGAIGFHKNNPNPSSAVSSVKTVKFDFTDVTGGNRVFDSNTTIHGFYDNDGDKEATFRDVYGYLTGTAGSQIVRATPFNMNAGCYIRSSWNLAVCPQIYGKLTVFKESQEGNGKTVPFAVRDDIPHVRELRRSWASAVQFMTVLGGGYSYTINWSHYVPHQFSIRGQGVEKGKWVRFGVCLPRNAQFDLYSYSPKFVHDIKGWISVSSIKELEADHVGDKYFWDSDVGLLFLKFMNFNTRTASDSTECPPAGCPHVRITLSSGDTLDGDCTTRAYNGTYNRTSNHEAKILTNIKLPATMTVPLKTWGAGATRPFDTRTRLDGKFGDWADWSSCSKACEGGMEIRYRWCNNPIPQNGGKHCVGKTSETRPCNSQKCAVDGGWSDFSVWSSCNVITGCHGFQKKTRTCDNPVPAHNGKYCEGSDDEVRSCSTC